MTHSNIRFYNKEEAIARMNALAMAKKPFLFVIDFDGENCIVEAESEIDNRLLRYNFNGKNNDFIEDFGLSGNFRWSAENPSRSSYQQSFDYVHNEIMRGNSFLVNLTCRVPIQTDLSLLDIYRRADAKYRLWIKDRLVCFSPETFIQVENGEIASFPMKGTIDASLPDAQSQLLSDPKETAEHATIVDLIRNDLSLVAHHVCVCNYRYAECLQTHKGPLIQTSSEIRGTLHPPFRDRPGDLIFSQLPAGSITGAPKERTVRIIKEAEGYQRGFYTGVMGRWENGTIDSAVMIRFIDQEAGNLYFKAGGGITARSEWEKEYDEVIQKTYVPICRND